MNVHDLATVQVLCQRDDCHWVNFTFQESLKEKYKEWEYVCRRIDKNPIFTKIKVLRKHLWHREKVEKGSKFCHMKQSTELKIWWHKNLISNQLNHLWQHFRLNMKISTSDAFVCHCWHILATLITGFSRSLYGEIIDVIYVFLYYEMFSPDEDIFKWIILGSQHFKKKYFHF